MKIPFNKRMSKTAKLWLLRGGGQKTLGGTDAPHFRHIRNIFRLASTLYVLSMGGGVDSTALYFLLRAIGAPLDLVIFADTGSDMPETMAHIKVMASICAADGIPFYIVKNNKWTLLQHCLHYKIFPVVVRKWCTNQFKIQPIRQKYRQQMKLHKKRKVVEYLGIDIGEFWNRAKDPSVKYIEHSYPLADFKLTRDNCIAINKGHGFENIIKSRCWFCMYQSDEELYYVYKTHPHLWQKMLDLEKQDKKKMSIFMKKRTFAVLNKQENYVLREIQSPVYLTEIQKSFEQGYAFDGTLFDAEGGSCGAVCHS